MFVRGFTAASDQFVMDDGQPSGGTLEKFRQIFEIFGAILKIFY